MLYKGQSLREVGSGLRVSHEAMAALTALTALHVSPADSVWGLDALSVLRELSLEAMSRDDPFLLMDIVTPHLTALGRDQRAEPRLEARPVPTAFRITNYAAFRPQGKGVRG